MILVDTGPLVALFDATDHSHAGCRRILSRLDDRLATTLPVLTEAFHLLRPETHRVSGLIDFIRDGGAAVIPLEHDGATRCFELMQRYADIPMDFADASIVAAAEQVGTDKVFTLDRKHFGIYRLARGYHQVPFRIVGDPSGPQLVREGAAEADLVGAAVPLSEEPAG
ncbi:MAG: PIN domain-containing protein [Gemmatimonadetes bacterium]|nr:PIN domain-containing protein [Gemmatimonadota bacterium]MXX72488.1 PIN domain-containing protein [Gemmatimonadota bacterium]MYC93183.1 PIN domain-containing protein [Gemmatimonadota bacterium]MYG36524.1 PIN domain-containing protein [Gemmatimonadota bacterium]MYJ17409.1 PIN domain-containing protein [Gemmatimonadota bacterium]